MKIVVSTAILRTFLNSLFIRQIDIVSWQLAPTGILFKERRAGFYHTCHAYVEVSAKSGISEKDINIEFLCDLDQWRNMSQALHYMPEQHITIQFAPSAEKLLQGDTGISIRNALLVFPKPRKL